MSAYYSLGHRPERRRHGIRTFLLLFVCLGGSLAGGGWWLVHHNTAVIKNAPVHVSEISQTSQVRKQFDEDLFSFRTATYWFKSSQQLKPYRQYNYRSIKPNYDARTLAIYVDTVPPNLPLNRVVLATAASSHLAVGAISDNCGSLLSPAVHNRQEAQGRNNMPVVWRDILFVCNVSNYTANVTAAAEPGSSGAVSLTGPHGGKHQYYFVFTDRSPAPAYGSFQDILKSFQVK